MSDSHKDPWLDQDERLLDQQLMQMEDAFALVKWLAVAAVLLSCCGATFFAELLGGAE